MLTKSLPILFRSELGHLKFKQLKRLPLLLKFVRSASAAVVFEVVHYSAFNFLNVYFEKRSKFQSRVFKNEEKPPENLTTP
jgi:hypothetical protein